MSDPSAVPPPPPPQGGFAPPPAPPAGGFAAPPAPSGMATAPGGAPLQLSTPGKRFGAMLLEIPLFFVTLGIGYIVWMIYAWTKAQSPAKQVLKMRVVKLDENRPANIGEMLLRELVGKSLVGNVTFGIGYVVGGIMVVTDDTSHQGLWDKLANTTVVEDPNNQFGL